MATTTRKASSARPPRRSVNTAARIAEAKATRGRSKTAKVNVVEDIDEDLEATENEEVDSPEEGDEEEVVVVQKKKTNTSKKAKQEVIEESDEGEEDDDSIYEDDSEEDEVEDSESEDDDEEPDEDDDSEEEEEEPGDIDASDSDDDEEDDDTEGEEEDEEFESSDRSLYTKYRPRSFEELIGQDVAVKALRNIVRRSETPGESFSHAYIFSGTRGSGKTTSARIVAAALNCKHKTKKRPFDPCGKCDECRAVLSGARTSSVEEINAAERRGIDSMRELVDSNRLSAPSRYRVVIIDEAHQVTKDGASILLKEMEEPSNDQVVYILCTTDPAQILHPIRSRSTKIHFSNINNEDLQSLLLDIAKKEGIELDKKTALTIARQGQGSARDAISKLDEYNLGIVDTSIDLSIELIQSIIDDDISAAFSAVVTHLATRQERSKKDFDVDSYASPVTALEMIANFWHSAIIHKSAPDLVSVAEGLEESLKIASKEYSDRELVHNLQISTNAYSQALVSPDPRIVLDACIAGLMRQSSRDRLDVFGGVLKNIEKKLDMLLEEEPREIDAEAEDTEERPKKSSNSKSKVKFEPVEDESEEDEEDDDELENDESEELEPEDGSEEEFESDEEDDDDSESDEDEDEGDDEDLEEGENEDWGDEEGYMSPILEALAEENWANDDGASELLAEFCAENLRVRDRKAADGIRIFLDPEDETNIVIETSKELSTHAQGLIESDALWIDDDEAPEDITGITFEFAVVD